MAKRAKPPDGNGKPPPGRKAPPTRQADQGKAADRTQQLQNRRKRSRPAHEPPPNGQASAGIQAGGITAGGAGGGGADGRETARRRLGAVTAADIDVPPREWLSPGRLSMGAVWLLDGSKGTGKSAMAAAVAAAVTGGPQLPGGERRTWGDVLWIAGEEDLGTVKRKLAAAGADLNQVRFPGREKTGQTSETISAWEHEEELLGAVRDYRAAAIIIDPLSCAAGGVDLNQEQPARTVMSALTRIAEETGCLVLGIRHPRKTSVANPLERGMGNNAIAAAARGVLTAGKEPDTGRRVLGVLACNLARPAPTIRYELVDVGGVPCVRWGEEISLEPDRIEFGVVEDSVELERMDAKLLLRTRIGDGWVKSKHVLDEAEAAGISRDALKRARAKLGVRTTRQGKKGKDGWWEMGPPVNGWPPGL